MYNMFHPAFRMNAKYWKAKPYLCMSLQGFHFTSSISICSMEKRNSQADT